VVEVKIKVKPVWERLDDVIVGMWGHDYIEHIPYHNRLEFWPFIPKVKRIKLRNVGPIKKLDAEFSPGLNVIYGRGGSGKSIILECLQGMIRTEGRMSLERLKSLYHSGAAHIEIEVFPKMLYDFKKSGRLPKIGDPKLLSLGEKYMIFYKSILALAKPHQAVVIDDAFSMLTTKNTTKQLKLMGESKNQVIITTRDPNIAKEAEEKFGAKIIQLKDQLC